MVSAQRPFDLEEALPEYPPELPSWESELKEAGQ